MCTGELGYQKSVLDILELEFQTTVSRPTGCWDPNFGPLKELQAPSAAGPSLQFHFLVCLEFARCNWLKISFFFSPWSHFPHLLLKPPCSP